MSKNIDDLRLDKPYAEIRAIKRSRDLSIWALAKGVRLYRESPTHMRLQIRVPTAKTVKIAGVTLTPDELRQMADYADSCWPEKACKHEPYNTNHRHPDTGEYAPWCPKCKAFVEL